MRSVEGNQELHAANTSFQGREVANVIAGCQIDCGCCGQVMVDAEESGGSASHGAFPVQVRTCHFIITLTLII